MDPQEYVQPKASHYGHQHFGMHNLCKKHNKLFTFNYIEECDAFSGYQDIRKCTNILKDFHITKWDKEERWHGIALFAYLTV
jgi:hypothetical protein